VDPEIAAVVAREESRMQREPGYRSGRRTLERLAAGYILYGDENGEWDRFNVHEVVLRGRVPGAAKIAAAKRRGSEVAYLRMLQRDRRLRERFLSPSPKGAKSR
jgi:hypothetical protein